MIKKSILFKTVCIILIAAFSFENVLWANPDVFKKKASSDTLQVQSPFNNSTSKILPEAMWQYVVREIPDIDNLRHRVAQTYRGVTCLLDFTPQTTDYKIGKYEEGDNWVVPCSVRTSSKYWKGELLIGKNPDENGNRAVSPRGRKGDKEALPIFEEKDADDLTEWDGIYRDIIRKYKENVTDSALLNKFQEHSLPKLLAMIKDIKTLRMCKDLIFLYTEGVGEPSDFVGRDLVAFLGNAGDWKAVKPSDEIVKDLFTHYIENKGRSPNLYIRFVLPKLFSAIKDKDTLIACRDLIFYCTENIDDPFNYIMHTFIPVITRTKNLKLLTTPVFYVPVELNTVERDPAMGNRKVRIARKMALAQEIKEGRIIKIGKRHYFPVKNLYFPYNKIHNRSHVYKSSAGDKVYKGSGSSDVSSDSFRVNGLAFNFKKGKMMHLLEGGLPRREVSVGVALLLRKTYRKLKRDNNPALLLAEEHGARIDMLVNPIALATPLALPVIIEEELSGDAVGLIEKAITPPDSLDLPEEVKLVPTQDYLDYIGIPKKSTKRDPVFYAYNVPVNTRMTELSKKPLGLKAIFEYYGYKVEFNATRNVITKVTKDGEDVNYQKAAEQIYISTAARYALFLYMVHEELDGSVTDIHGTIFSAHNVNPITLFDYDSIRLDLGQYDTEKPDYKDEARQALGQLTVWARILNVDTKKGTDIFNQILAFRNTTQTPKTEKPEIEASRILNMFDADNEYQHFLNAVEFINKIVKRDKKLTIDDVVNLVKLVNPHVTKDNDEDEIEVWAGQFHLWYYDEKIQELSILQKAVETFSFIATKHSFTNRNTRTAFLLMQFVLMEGGCRPVYIETEEEWKDFRNVNTEAIMKKLIRSQDSPNDRKVMTNTILTVLGGIGAAIGTLIYKWTEVNILIESLKHSFVATDRMGLLPWAAVASLIGFTLLLSFGFFLWPEHSRVPREGSDYIVKKKLFDKFVEAGMRLFDVYDLKGAEHELLSAIGIVDTDPLPYSLLTLVCGLQGKLEDAIYFAKKSIEVDPNFYRGYVSLATLLLEPQSSEEDRLKKAEKYCLKAIELDNECVDAYLVLGQVLCHSEQTEEVDEKKERAETCFLRAIALDQKYGRAYYAYGKLIFAKNPGDGAWYLEKAASLDADLSNVVDDELVAILKDMKRLGVEEITDVINDTIPTAGEPLSLSIDDAILNAINEQLSLKAGKFHFFGGGILRNTDDQKSLTRVSNEEQDRQQYSRIILRVYKLLRRGFFVGEIEALKLHTLVWKEKDLSVDMLFENIPRLREDHAEYMKWVTGDSTTRQRHVHSAYFKQIERYAKKDLSKVPPLVITINEKGKYELLDGLMRIIAAKLREDSTITAYVGRVPHVFKEKTYVTTFVPENPPEVTGGLKDWLERARDISRLKPGSVCFQVSVGISGEVVGIAIANRVDDFTNETPLNNQWNRELNPKLDFVMYIRSDVRLRGVGSALLDALMGHARENDYKLIGGVKRCGGEAGQLVSFLRDKKGFTIADLPGEDDQKVAWKELSTTGGISEEELIPRNDGPIGPGHNLILLAGLIGIGAIFAASMFFYWPEITNLTGSLPPFGKRGLLILPVLLVGALVPMGNFLMPANGWNPERELQKMKKLRAIAEEILAMERGIRFSKNPEADLLRTEELIKEGLSIEPQSTYLHNMLGGIYILMKKIEEAEYHLRKGVEYGPKAASALLNLAYFTSIYKAWTLENRKEAEELRREAIKLDPTLEDDYRERVVLEKLDSWSAKDKSGTDKRKHTVEEFLKLGIPWLVLFALDILSAGSLRINFIIFAALLILSAYAYARLHSAGLAPYFPAFAGVVFSLLLASLPPSSRLIQFIITFTLTLFVHFWAAGYVKRLRDLGLDEVYPTIRNTPENSNTVNEDSGVAKTGEPQQKIVTEPIHATDNVLNDLIRNIIGMKIGGGVVENMEILNMGGIEKGMGLSIMLKGCTQSSDTTDLMHMSVYPDGSMYFSMHERPSYSVIYEILSALPSNKLATMVIVEDWEKWRKFPFRNKLGYNHMPLSWAAFSAASQSMEALPISFETRSENTLVTDEINSLSELESFIKGFDNVPEFADDFMCTLISLCIKKKDITLIFSKNEKSIKAVIEFTKTLKRLKRNPTFSKLFEDLKYYIEDPENINQRKIDAVQNGSQVFIFAPKGADGTEVADFCKEKEENVKVVLIDDEEYKEGFYFPIAHIADIAFLEFVFEESIEDILNIFTSLKIDGDKINLDLSATKKNDIGTITLKVISRVLQHRGSNRITFYRELDRAIQNSA